MYKLFVYWQNGSVERILPSPEGSLDGSVVGGDSNPDTAAATIVESSHYITVTGLSVTVSF